MEINSYGNIPDHSITDANKIVPPATGLACSCYMKSTDAFYLFGGQVPAFGDDAYGDGFGMTNNLWKLSISNMQWSILGQVRSPNNYGNYVEKGLYSNNSWPASRIQCKLSCNENQNLLYLQGGYDYLVDKEISFPDFWIYNCSSNLWKWVAYRYDEILEPMANITYGLYGNAQAYDIETNSLILIDGYKYEPETINTYVFSFNFTSGQTRLLPQAIVSDGLYLHWVADVFDRVNREFFLLMGSNYGEFAYFSNVYSFNIKTGEWQTRSKYSSAANAPSRYGSKWKYNKNFFPSSRVKSSSSLDNSRKKIYLFGGRTYEQLDMNDLWVFNLNLNQWSFIGGSLTGEMGVYGEKLVSSDTIFPGPRCYLNTFIDENLEKFFIFGGMYKLDLNNELWSFDFSEAQVSASDSTKVTTLKPTYTFQLHPETKAFLGSNSSPNHLELIPILVSVFGILVLLIILLLCKRRKKVDVTKISFSQSFKSGQEPSSNLTMQTLVDGITKIYIPGYLQFEAHEFRIIKEIARGGNSIIYLGENLSKSKSTEVHIIIKRMGDNYEDLKNNEKYAFDQEVSVSEVVRSHNGIAKLIGFCYRPCCILMKYYQEGSLYVWIKRKDQKFSCSVIVNFSVDISSALKFLHAKCICHCDVKPQNVLIEFDSQQHRYIAVLTDFGISNVLDSKAVAVKSFKISNLIGLSIHYASPEAFLRMRHKMSLTADILKSGDIFSFGGIIYYMLNKKTPKFSIPTIKGSSISLQSSNLLLSDISNMNLSASATADVETGVSHLKSTAEAATTSTIISKGGSNNN